jgi:hypothetical protein
LVDGIKQPLVQLSLMQTEDGSGTQSFTYKCVSFKENYMEFQANFTYFDQISVVHKDVMMAKFNGPQYFRTPDDATFV